MQIAYKYNNDEFFYWSHLDNKHEIAAFGTHSNSINPNGNVNQSKMTFKNELIKLKQIGCKADEKIKVHALTLVNGSVQQALGLIPFLIEAEKQLKKNVVTYSMESLPDILA